MTKKNNSSELLPINPKRCRAPLATALQSTGYSRRDFLATAIAAPVIVSALPAIVNAKTELATIFSPNKKAGLLIIRDTPVFGGWVWLQNRRIVFKAVLGGGQHGLARRNAEPKKGAI